MSKRWIKQIRPHVALYRDDRTGIAWVENGEAGLAHSCHANICVSGSLPGMRKNGGWGDDRVVTSHGTHYNIDTHIVTDDLDRIAAEACWCVGCNERRARQGDRPANGVITNLDDLCTLLERMPIDRRKECVPFVKLLDGTLARIRSVDFVSDEPVMEVTTD